MPLTGTVADQLRSIDAQIIDLLHERAGLCGEILEDDAHALDASAEAEILEEWQGAADEKGLSIGAMTLICKGVGRLCRAGE